MLRLPKNQSPSAGMLCSRNQQHREDFSPFNCSFKIREARHSAQFFEATDLPRPALIRKQAEIADTCFCKKKGLKGIPTRFVRHCGVVTDIRDLRVLAAQEPGSIFEGESG